MSTPILYLNKLMDRYKLIYDWIPETTPRLLDIGCGNLNFTKWFRDKAEVVIGTDHNPDQPASSINKFPGISALASAGEHLPFKDEYFDIVIMSDVLEHVQNDKMTIDEVIRIIRPGGSLIISLPNTGPLALFDGDNVINRFVWFLSLLKIPKGRKPDGTLKRFYEGFEYVRHRHYSLKELMELIDSRLVIEKRYYGGTIIWPLAYMVEKILEVFFKQQLITKNYTFLRTIRAMDFKLGIGSWSYNLVVQLKKEE